MDHSSRDIAAAAALEVVDKSLDAIMATPDEEEAIAIAEVAHTASSRCEKDSKLITNADGSIDLYFGPAAPAGKESNWVKTLPSRGWWVWFRLYGPLEPFFNKTWQLADFELVK